jgi:hypothetical protein
MPITLGILAQSRQAVATGAFVLLESQVLSSAAASVTFSSLGTYASTYQHLQLRILSRSASSNEDYLYLRFNSDTGSNYRAHLLEGNGSSVASQSFSQTELFIGVEASAQQAANIYGGFVIDILDAFETTKNKTIRSLGGYATRSIILSSGLWMNTSATTTLTLKNSSVSNLAAGSRFSLYGVKATA